MAKLSVLIRVNLWFNSLLRGFAGGFLLWLCDRITLKQKKNASPNLRFLKYTMG